VESLQTWSDSLGLFVRRAAGSGRAHNGERRGVRPGLHHPLTRLRRRQDRERSPRRCKPWQTTGKIASQMNAHRFWQTARCMNSMPGSGARGAAAITQKLRRRRVHGGLKSKGAFNCPNMRID
jgi:hypothetical protein